MAQMLVANGVRFGAEPSPPRGTSEKMGKTRQQRQVSGRSEGEGIGIMGMHGSIHTEYILYVLHSMYIRSTFYVYVHTYSSKVP